MWFPAETIATAAGDVITTAAAMVFLREDRQTEAAVVADCVADAVGEIEAYTGTRLLTQTVVLRAGGFADLDHLPIGPVQSITSITYLDPLGVRQTLDPTLYELFGSGLARGIRPAYGARFPAIRAVGDAIAVTAVVGYGTAGDMPTPVRRALLLTIGDYYNMREDTVTERSVVPASLPNGVGTILTNFRIYG